MAGIGTVPPYLGSTAARRRLVTWFLVAEEAWAQVYVRGKVKARRPAGRRKRAPEKAETDLVPVVGMQWEALPQGESDMLGNVFKGIFDSMMQPANDNRQRFVRTIASQLQVALSQQSYDRLVLIAPATLLAEFKLQMDRDVLDRVVAELPKEIGRQEGSSLAAGESTL